MQKMPSGTSALPSADARELALASDLTRSVGPPFGRSISSALPTHRFRWAAWRISYLRKIEPETVKFGRFGLVSGFDWSLVGRTVTAVRVSKWSHGWYCSDGESDRDFLVVGTLWGWLAIVKRGRKLSSSRSRWLWRASGRPCRRDRWVNSADCCGFWSCVSSCSFSVLWKVCVQNWG
jgi:hypothetical protein